MSDVTRRNRRRFLGMAAASAVGLSGLPALRAQQAWPAKPVRVVVGYPAGGLTDILARLYSEHLSQKLLAVIAHSMTH